jgi:hypothetical protein
VPKHTLEGPKDMFGLSESSACGVLTSAKDGIRDFVADVTTAPIDLSEADKWQYCMDALNNGEVSVVVHSRNAVRAYLQDGDWARCDTLSETSWLSVNHVTTAFVLRQESAGLATNISLAIDAFVASPKYNELVSTSMHADECPIDSSIEDMDAVQLEDMVGLLIIVGSITGFGVLLGVVRLYAKVPDILDNMGADVEVGPAKPHAISCSSTPSEPMAPTVSEV